MSTPATHTALPDELKSMMETILSQNQMILGRIGVIDEIERARLAKEKKLLDRLKKIGVVPINSL